MLKIYKEPSSDAGFSFGDFTKPLFHSFNGTTGAIVEAKYYIRNDNENYWYSNITVQPVDGGENIVNGSGVTKGFSWRLIEGDAKPSEQQWEFVTPGASISFSNIGSASSDDTSTYLPFWIKIEVPKNAFVSSFSKVKLKISAAEAVV